MPKRAYDLYQWNRESNEGYSKWKFAQNTDLGVICSQQLKHTPVQIGKKTMCPEEEAFPVGMPYLSPIIHWKPLVHCNSVEITFGIDVMNWCKGWYVWKSLYLVNLQNAIKQTDTSYCSIRPPYRPYNFKKAISSVPWCTPVWLAYLHSKVAWHHY